MATFLRAVFEECGPGTREGWAKLLDVSEASLSLWANDRTLPRPSALRGIVTRLRDDPSTPSPLREEMEAILAAPVAKVTPKHDRVDGTLGAYVIRPLVDRLLDTLDDLSFAERENILHGALNAAAGREDARRTELREAAVLGGVTALGARMTSQALDAFRLTP